MVRSTLLLTFFLACSGGSSPAPDASPDKAEAPQPETQAPVKQEAAEAPNAEAPPSEAPPAELPALTLDSPITQENWKTHPRIVAIRKQVAMLEKGMDGGRGYTFEDHCGDRGIYSAKLHPFHPSETDVYDAKYHMVDGNGDIKRDTMVYFDPEGRPLFATSIYAHSSAESKSISRQYYHEGKLIFTPEVELQAGELGGPADPEKLADLVPASSVDAFLKISATARDCGI